MIKRLKRILGGISIAALLTFTVLSVYFPDFIEEAKAQAISTFVALTGAGSATGDLFVVVDISEVAAADRTKNITRDELAIALQGGGLLLDLIDDTTPQLGGSLDINGNEITGAIDIHSTGDVILELGDNAGVNKVIINDSDSAEVASIDSDGKVEGTHLHTIDTSTEIGDHLVEFTIDFDGFGDVHAIETHMDTGVLAAGEDQVAHDIEFNDADSTGGNAHGISVSRTGDGSASIGALKVNAEVDVIDQDSGTFGNVESFLIIAVDFKAEANSAATADLPYFLAQDDTITVGSLAKFGAIDFVISTGASGGGIAPTFEFSTGPGAWDDFVPIDNTSGWKHSGTVNWVVANLLGWAVDGSANFLVRVKRNRVSLSTEPIGSQVQVASTNVFGWDKDGNLSVNTGDFAGDVTMASGAQIFIDDGDSTDLAISATSNSTVGLYVTGTSLRFGGARFTGSNNASAGLVGDEASSVTNPTLSPSRGDFTTGIGGANNVSVATIIKSKERFTVTDSLSKFAGDGDNGAFLNVQSASATAAFDSDGNTHTFANLIPDGAYLLALTIRVTETIVGATTITIGDGSTADLWGTGIDVAVGTTTDATDYTTTAAVGTLYLTDNDVVITAVGGAGDFSDGTVRAVIFYMNVTAPIQ